MGVNYVFTYSLSIIFVYMYTYLYVYIQGRTQDFTKVGAGRERPHFFFASRCETASHPPPFSHSSLIRPTSTLHIQSGTEQKNLGGQRDKLA